VLSAFIFRELDQRDYLGNGGVEDGIRGEEDGGRRIEKLTFNKIKA
jgi:hypothetical protein